MPRRLDVIVFRRIDRRVISHIAANCQQFERKIVYKIHLNLKSLSGGGSYPPFERGLHLKSRHIPANIPRISPRLLMVCRVYSEHVGVYRQVWRERRF